MNSARWLLLALLLPLGTAPAAAQEVLTLRDALARAGQHGFPNRLAQAERTARYAERDLTLQGILPSLRIEAAWSRTTDPLGAFGARLRQRGVSAESFSPDRLNDPAATGNAGTGLVAELPLLQPEAWLGRRAAGSAAAAADAAARWAGSLVQLDVVRAYFGGILAGEQVTALDAGLAAARSHVRRTQALLEQGIVTRSDVLLAEVRAGEVEAQLLAARGSRRLAIRRLALALGLPEDTAFTLPQGFADSSRLIGLIAPRVPAPRADLEAARLGAVAARQDVARATSLLLPSLGSFGRLDWNTNDAWFGGRSAWTVGVIARWSVFGGGSELSARSRARAEAVRADARADAAAAQAELERDERRIEVDVARATLAIAARAVEQSADAHRIITRKYDGGLATVAELLEAAALETRTRVEHSAAIYRLLAAAAAWQVALGYDLTSFTELDRRSGTP